VTPNGSYRLNFLRDAIVANPGTEWTPASVMNLMRADGTPIDRASAHSLLNRLETTGTLRRIDQTGRRYWIGAAT
jgi:hypothetical protein